MTVKYVVRELVRKNKYKFAVYKVFTKLDREVYVQKFEDEENARKYCERMNQEHC